MMNVSSRPTLANIVTLVLASTALAQSGGVYDLTWNTYDGGGETSTGGGITLSGTVGQPDAGAETLTGGDCDVDQSEFGLIQLCQSDADVPADPNCAD